MGFKEDMSRQFGRIGRKTSALFEETKLRSQISSLENDIKNLYITVGTTIFSMWKHENVDIGRLVKYFEAIQKKQEEIEEKKTQILQVKARGGEDMTEENAGGKQLRPLLPDFNGKRGKAEPAAVPASADSESEEPKKNRTSARAGGEGTIAFQTETDSAGEDVIASRTGAEPAGAGASRTGAEPAGAGASRTETEPAGADASRTEKKSAGADAMEDLDEAGVVVTDAMEDPDEAGVVVTDATEDPDEAGSVVADAKISMEDERSKEEAPGAHSMTGGCSEAASSDHVVIEEEDEASVLQEKFNVNEAVKMVLPDPVQESGYAYCSRCGAACPAGARFCRRCGAKIEV